MAEYLIQEATLTVIGDAIRKKRGTTGKLAPGKMPEEIEAIQTGPDTSDATIAAEDVVSGKIGYGKNDTRITGAMEKLTQAALPTAPTENNNYFEFTAKNQSTYKLYVPAGGSFSAILQRTMLGTCEDADVLKGQSYSSATGVNRTGSMPNNAAAVLTIASKDDEPSIAKGYHSGGGKAQLDGGEKAKLIPANIRAGITLLGVVGTMSPTEGMKLQSKSVTPTKAAQDVTPGSGYNGLSKVTVEAIPAKYPDVSGDTVAADTLLSGTTAHDSTGAAITGTYVPLDTSDATATSDDIASGKTAYVKGQKVAGDVTVYDSGTSLESTCFSMFTAQSADTGVEVMAKYSHKRPVMLKEDATVYLTGLASEFGKASPSDVVSGKTFTSSAGLKVKGTASEVEPGFEVGILLDSADVVDAEGNLKVKSKVSNDTMVRPGGLLITPLPLATLGDATAFDVVGGKTFTSSSGVKVNGALSDAEDTSLPVQVKYNSGIVGDYFSFVGNPNKDTVVRTATSIVARVPPSEFGSASTAQVLAGATFTSDAGVKVTGTYIPLDTSDATAAASDIVKGKTAYVDGSKVTGTMADLTSAGATYSSGAVAQGVFRAYGKSNSTGKITRTSTAVTMNIPSNNLGNAAAQHVKEGVTFTSEAGLKLTGTAATVNTGSPSFIDNHWTDDTSYRVLATPKTNGFCMYDIPIETPVSKSQFGDATASDVAKGKTFTSQNGIKITGTMEAIALDSIAVKLSKTDYAPGDSFDQGTVSVTAYYTNGASKDMDENTGGYTVTAPDTSTAGTKTGTVSYTEGGVTKTASFTVTVMDKVEDDVITYTGSMTDQIVTMSGVAYRLLILTSSGTLNFAKARKGDVWMVAGGNGGMYGADYGSAGGYSSQSSEVSLSGSNSVVIGAGGERNYTYASTPGFGGATAFGSITTKGPSSSSYFQNGGTGGGGRSMTSGGGTGDGLSKYPFGDTSGAKLRSTGAVVSGTDKPHCGGGGGGGMVDREDDNERGGGNGGTNGGNGGTGSSSDTGNAAGGEYGGGKGGSNATTQELGTSASFFGGGGGSGSYYCSKSGSITRKQGGNGYQGVAYIRIPLDQTIYN